MIKSLKGELNKKDIQIIQQKEELNSKKEEIQELRKKLEQHENNNVKKEINQKLIN